MPVDFQWTPVRRKFLEQCLQRKLEPALIATAISDVLCVPCDTGIVEKEAFKIALEIIDGLKPKETSDENIAIVSHGPETRICQNEKCGKPFTVRLRGGGKTQKYCSKRCANIISHAKNKVTPLAIITVTSDSGTDRPSLGKLDGVVAVNEEAMEAVSVPEVVETPPPAALSQEEKIARGSALIGAKKREKHEKPIKKKNRIIESLEQAIAEPWTIKVHTPEDMEALSARLAAEKTHICAHPPCGKEFIQNYKKQIYCSRRCNQAATRARAKAKNDVVTNNPDQELIKSSTPIAAQIEDKVVLEFAEPKFDFYVKNPIEHTPPIIKDEGQIPRGPYQSQLIKQVVVPIQGDPPPGRSEYDRMLRGEK